MNTQELIDTLNNLDVENIGSWPMPIKATIWLISAALVGTGVYQLMLSKSLAQLERVQAEESTLMKQYEERAFKAANLEQYKQQMQEMEHSFGALLRQLPSDTEVPGLLEDISHTGLGSGLEFESINLGTESLAEFYAELPIDITVRGGYHALGTFISGVAALPRIVTLHDFSIGSKENPNDLSMSIVAKTYRYNDSEDE